MTYEGTLFLRSTREKVAERRSLIAFLLGRELPFQPNFCSRTGHVTLDSIKQEEEGGDRPSLHLCQPAFVAAVERYVI